jgi:putative FmdB family regulatory protein
LPLYEYRCAQCGRQIEKIQKFSDPPLTTCEECGGGLERLLSSPAIHFKGSGWYVTDYARKSPSGETAKAESPSCDKAAKSAETTGASSAQDKPAASK